MTQCLLYKILYINVGIRSHFFSYQCVRIRYMYLRWYVAIVDDLLQMDKFVPGHKIALHTQLWATVTMIHQISGMFLRMTSQGIIIKETFLLKSCYGPLITVGHVRFARILILQVALYLIDGIGGRGECRSVAMRVTHIIWVPVGRSL